MLFLLLFLPVLVVLYLRLQQRRRKIIAQYGSLGLVSTTARSSPSGRAASAAPRSPGFRRHLPPLLLLAGLALLVIAMARPQAVVSLPKKEGTVILAFDVSGSMAADDMKPTRMEAAKAAARDFIRRQPRSVQIGVVAFSDNGFSMQIPTNERDAILAAIDRLAPQHGTSLAHGINASLQTIATALGHAQGPLTYSSRAPEPTPSPTPVPKGTYTPAVVVLLTDGENNENPDPLAAAQDAADHGVRIYTVGIGSAAGTTVNINGFHIHTQLDEPMLQQIAQITGGDYYNASSTQELLKIYETIDPSLVIKPQKTEITSLFAGASIIVLLVSGLFSLFWFNRLP